MNFTEVVTAVRDDVSRVSSVFVDVVSRTAIYQSLASGVSRVVTYLRQQSPTLNNIISSYSHSLEVRTIVNQAFLANMVQYALPVMAYEGYVRPNYMDGSEYQNYLDYPVKLFFCGMFVCMFVNNTAYNLALSKSLTQFVPKPEKDHACKCIETTRIAAAFTNVFHTMGNIGSASLIYWAPKIVDYLSGLRTAQLGAYVSYVLQSFAYGYCLVTMKYAHHGICAKHRRALANNNKAYCFLVGASFLLLTQGGSYALNTVAGTEENTFINDAVFSHLYHFFIMFGLLKVGTLSADKKAWDLFYYQRSLVDGLLRSRSNKVVQELRPQEKKQSYTRLANHYLDTRVVRAAASTTAISLLLSTHHDEIRSGIETIIEKQGYPLWVLDYLPYFTPQSLKILKNVLMQQGWEDTRLLLLKVIEIALKQRERAEVVTRLFASFRLKENYIPVASEVDVKFDGAIGAIEEYEPREFDASFSAGVNRVENYVAEQKEPVPDGDEGFELVDDTPESRVSEWMGLQR